MTCRFINTSGAINFPLNYFMDKGFIRELINICPLIYLMKYMFGSVETGNNTFVKTVLIKQIKRRLDRNNK